LEQICKTLGDSFTGSQITNFLNQANIAEILPSNHTKWKRLYASFREIQSSDNSSNAVLNYIKIVSHPVNFLDPTYGSYDEYLNNVNSVLSF
jgi:hypothetical protein